ncbi:hypothetical protein ACFL0T_08440 [Candidatus Omnitrophota bacterium]
MISVVLRIIMFLSVAIYGVGIFLLSYATMGLHSASQIERLLFFVPYSLILLSYITSLPLLMFGRERGRKLIILSATIALILLLAHTIQTFTTFWIKYFDIVNVLFELARMLLPSLLIYLFTRSKVKEQFSRSMQGSTAHYMELMATTIIAATISFYLIYVYVSSWR